MIGKKQQALFGIFVLLGAGLTGAQAQPPQAPPPSGPGVLDRLHNDLQLNPSQESAWQSFQQAYRVDPQDMAQESAAEARMPSMTGPQRVDMAISMAQKDLDGLHRRGDALKAFYASLSPQQQHVFDRDTLEPPPGQGNY